MLTIERIKSLPKDKHYDKSFVLKPFDSDLDNGVITFIIKIRGCVECYIIDTWFDRNVEFNLQEYFTDWLNPTQEENTLWTLETGFELIETYVKQMEKLMKEFKYV